MIDLRSDTITKPTKGMLSAMFAATVGDDVFGEDPTVNELESRLAAMFDMEAGLFCPSGTMANQIAIKAHTQPLDEIICDNLSHIYNYETGGWAFHSGVSIRLTRTSYGVLSKEDVEPLLLPDFDWYPNTKMVCIENTVNKGGGSIYPLATIQELSQFCRERNLVFHLDGARIFNALVATNSSPAQLHGLFDSISVCLSKGLGAPVGSVLLGKRDFIKRSRKIRKVMGGGMRQSGYLAAACLYAIDNHIDRLAEDHRHAQQLGAALAELNWVKHVYPVQTNIVIFEVENAAAVTNALKEVGILASPFSATHVRLVTHLDAHEKMIAEAITKIRAITL